MIFKLSTVVLCQATTLIEAETKANELRASLSGWTIDSLSIRPLQPLRTDPKWSTTELVCGRELLEIPAGFVIKRFHVPFDIWPRLSERITHAPDFVSAHRVLTGEIVVKHLVKTISPVRTR